MPPALLRLWRVKEGRLFVKQEKTRKEIWIRILPQLWQEINAIEKKNLTFLMTEYGAPFTAAGFGNWFRDRCVEAGVPGRAHGLRKAAASRMAEIGLSGDQIKSVTGHNNLKEVSIYTEGADQKRLADSAIEALEQDKTRTDFVQPSNKVGQNEI